MGFSRKTFFELHNNTSERINTTEIYSVANYDWDGGARPDRNLQGRSISPGSSIREREEVNYWASNCPFTMILKFSDGTVDEFRVYQKYAIGERDGFQHRRKSHDIYYYRAGGDTLVVKVKNTPQQQAEHEAQQKNKQGEAAMKQKQYEAAMKLFDEAMGLANKSSTQNSIKKNKSEAYTQIGKKDFEEALRLELESQSDAAKTKFENAKQKSQQALALNNSGQNQENLKLINLKIDGNDLFNRGNEVEKAAYTLFQNGKYSEAQNKYKQANALYEDAAKKFEEGAKIDKVLGDSVKLTKETVENVKKTVNDIAKIELSVMMNTVNVDEEEEKEESFELADEKHYEIQVEIGTEM